MLGSGSLQAAAALTCLRFGELQLAVERVNLSRDVEDAGVRLVVAGNLGRQSPVIGDTLTRRYTRGKRHDQSRRVREAISQPVRRRRYARARYRTRFRPNKVDRR